MRRQTEERGVGIKGEKYPGPVFKHLKLQICSGCSTAGTTVFRKAAENNPALNLRCKLLLFLVGQPAYSFSHSAM